MKTIRRPIGLLAVLAAVLAVLSWFDPAPQDGAPSVAPPKKAPAATPPSVGAAQPPIPVPSKEAVVIAPPKPEAPPRPEAPSRTAFAPPVADPPPDFVPPVAAAGGNAEDPAGIGAQVSNAAEPKGDSVFEWGPWTGSGSAENAGAPTTQDGVPRVEGLSRTLSSAPPGAPPPVDSSINSGHGHGHTNHGHGHRR